MYNHSSLQNNNTYRFHYQKCWIKNQNFRIMSARISLWYAEPLAILQADRPTSGVPAEFKTKSAFYK